MTKIWLMCHAPLPAQSGLAGRRDISILPIDPAPLPALRRRIAQIGPDAVWSSPARRCRETCDALGLTPEIKPPLWEQDFGHWEDLPPSEIPDLGPLSVEDLARHRPPKGESFADMAARVQPCLERAEGNLLILCHAGTVRAALSLVVGPAALSFAVAPLSLTLLDGGPGCWSIGRVNWTPDP